MVAKESEGGPDSKGESVRGRHPRPDRLGGHEMGRPGRAGAGCRMGPPRRPVRDAAYASKGLLASGGRGRKA